jgi:hypothetical protein
MMGMAVILLMVAVLVAVALVAGFTIGAAVNPRTRRPLPPRPPSDWPGYQGAGGPDYPVYNPAHYLSPDDRERIMILIRGGQKIQAIKLYRAATGAGLAEAKAAVDYLERYR